MGPPHGNTISFELYTYRYRGGEFCCLLLQLFNWLYQDCKFALILQLRHKQLKFRKYKQQNFIPGSKITLNIIPRSSPAKESRKEINLSYIIHVFNTFNTKKMYKVQSFHSFTSTLGGFSLLLHRTTPQLASHADVLRLVTRSPLRVKSPNTVCVGGYPTSCKA